MILPLPEQETGHCQGDRALEGQRETERGMVSQRQGVLPTPHLPAGLRLISRRGSEPSTGTAYSKGGTCPEALALGKGRRNGKGGIARQTLSKTAGGL